ncbi:MAG: hypothetical protein FWC38_10095, partial [Proteobacteria bacterium]|nr:hypothetical protein [Pseudomonadota bacterium]
MSITTTGSGHRPISVNSGGTLSLVLAANTVNTVRAQNKAAGLGGPIFAITISGSGTLNAFGAEGHPGIYRGVTINSGVVNATGGLWGAGIGGADGVDGGGTIINGGTVTARGGGGAAGIGGGAGGTGGHTFVGLGYTGYPIVIAGGTVTAIGGGVGNGAMGRKYHGGAGIGGGVTVPTTFVPTYGYAGWIFISGGTVTATGGGTAAGIGGGGHFQGLTTSNPGGSGAVGGSPMLAPLGGGISITGGVVIATGGDGGGAGIGGGPASGSREVRIRGGVVTATGRGGGAGIGFGANRAFTWDALPSLETSSLSMSNESGGGIVFVSSLYNDNMQYTTIDNVTGGILFVGNTGTFYGPSVTMTDSATIPANHTLTVGSGQTLTIPSGKTLTNHGAVTHGMGGTIHINGARTGNLFIPVVQIWPTAGSGISLGLPLSASSLSGGSTSVPGAFRWTNGTFTPLSQGNHSDQIMFVPTNAANYYSVNGGTATVTVGPPPNFGLNPASVTLTDATVRPVAAIGEAAGAITVGTLTPPNAGISVTSTATGVDVAYIGTLPHEGAPGAITSGPHTITVTRQLVNETLTINVNIPELSFGLNPTSVTLTDAAARFVAATGNATGAITVGALSPANADIRVTPTATGVEVAYTGAMPSPSAPAAIALGPYTVTVTRQGVSETLTIDVDIPAVTLAAIVVDTLPDKTAYIVNEPLELAGLGITAFYTDGSTKTAAGFTTNLTDGTVLSALGEYTIEVSFTDGLETRTTSFGVEVYDLSATIDLSNGNPPLRGIGWTFSSETQVYTILDGADVLVIEESTNRLRRLEAEAGAEATITLQDATITSDGSALLLGAGAEVTLILADGSENTLEGSSYSAGIQTADAILTIEGETDDTGVLNVTGGGYGAGIGSGILGNAGTITIAGGTINATGGQYGAGIGGVSFSNISGSTITITGGTVNATGGERGAGIGGVSSNQDFEVKITGGTVNAIGGDFSAGIGGGSGLFGGLGSGGDGGTITITGGEVNAIGGERAAGIGGANGGAGGTITISGGTVTATGGAGAGANARASAGIGGGGGQYGSWLFNLEGGASGDILIYGESTVVAAKAGIVTGSTRTTQDIGPGAEYTGTEGSVFVALPEGQLIGTGDVEIGEPVLFRANPSTLHGIVAATLPAPFDAASPIHLMAGLDVSPGKTLSVMTSFGTEVIDFALSGYTISSPTNPATITGGYLMSGTAEVHFSGAATATITINTQPATSTTVTVGSISGSLTVAASVSPNGTPTYQWYSNSSASNTGGSPINGETGTSFTIPTGLTAGTYYYYCLVSAAGADSVASSVATVVVNPSSSVVFQGAFSRKTHGSVGTFDLPISATGSLMSSNPITVEPRSGGTNRAFE